VVEEELELETEAPTTAVAVVVVDVVQEQQLQVVVVEEPLEQAVVAELVGVEFEAIVVVVVDVVVAIVAVVVVESVVFVVGRSLVERVVLSSDRVASSPQEMLEESEIDDPRKEVLMIQMGREEKEMDALTSGGGRWSSERRNRCTSNGWYTDLVTASSTELGCEAERN